MDKAADRVTRLETVAPGVIRPLPAEEGAATDVLQRAASRHPAFVKRLGERPALRQFLVAALSLSPFLRDTAAAHPALLAIAAEAELEPRLRMLIDDARNAWRPVEGKAPSEAELMTALRAARREVSFLLALADLARLFTAKETTRWLSALAEACTAAAVDHLLFAAHAAGSLSLKDPAEPGEGSGLIVLGMGKLGGQELNYSSDIDLVVFFDREAGVLADPAEASDLYGRMMRRLVRILQERNADGYVFRTDLRLRPDPGSTPLAVSLDAALIYYAGRGQNWERAAFIKARPVAGDLEAGEAMLKLLTPFVFRKYLDYAAIADIHSIKRQIHAHRGHGAIAVKGHDVKLGRGGIREIEFFAQTQQLIAGGRMPALRARQTEAALEALAGAQWITPEIAAELTAAYWFLRDVEHRIQMVDDEQRHSLPQDDAGLTRIALMFGFADAAAFSAKLETVLKTVEARYARLFEREAGLSAAGGNLVFTGQGDDPQTLETLAALGFRRPADIARVIRSWHYGRYRATQSVEARERLTELMPALLKAFGESRRADEALLAFDGFLKGLPAGIQLFSLIGNNPPLMALLVTIMSAAPRLADIIARRPHVFDGMLDPALMAELPTRDYLAARLGTFLAGARHYEEILDRLRIFAAEQRFLIGIRLLTGAITGEVAARAFTHLADLVIAAALQAVEAEMRRAHGAFPGAKIAVIGMGKLGSFELTAGSDVDLILVYDHDDEAGQSDGEKPLDAARYFTRLTQRLIAALSAPTAEGVIFEVDFRLRPSGNKGPLATRLAAFAKYQREEAWTWEHMALTRARLVAGDDGLIEAARAVIAGILDASRDVAAIRADVAQMRALIEAEKPPRDLWDFKLIPGGLIDIEFVAQYLRLVAPAHGLAIDTYAMSTGEALEALGEKLMAPEDLAACLAALCFYTDVSQLLRLCLDTPFDPADAPAGLAERVCRIAGRSDIAEVEADILRLSQAVRAVFQRLTGAAAA